METEKESVDKGGRPSKYKALFNEQARKLCLLGATDKELADFFEVDVTTIHEWKKVHPSFANSIKRGKKLADATVVDKLFSRATGYSHADIDIKIVKGRIKKTRLTRHYPPDTTAAIFWLKNRDKENWRDKQHIDIDYNNLTDDQLERIMYELKKIANGQKG